MGCWCPGVSPGEGTSGSWTTPPLLGADWSGKPSGSPHRSVSLSVRSAPGVVSSSVRRVCAMERIPCVYKHARACVTRTHTKHTFVVGQRGTSKDAHVVFATHLGCHSLTDDVVMTSGTRRQTLKHHTHIAGVARAEAHQQIARRFNCLDTGLRHHALGNRNKHNSSSRRVCMTRELYNDTSANAWLPWLNAAFRTKAWKRSTARSPEHRPQRHHWHKSLP